MTRRLEAMRLDPQALLDALPDVVVAVDADANVLWMNAAGEEQFGWRLDDIRGRSGVELLHPDDVATAVTALVSVQDKPLGTPVELRVRAREGGYRLVELRGRSGVQVADLQAVVLVLRDITERRRWDVAGGDTDLLQSIIDNAPAITMLLNGEGTIRGSSRALTRLLGRDLEFAIGRPFSHLVIDEDRHLVESEIALVVSLGGRRAFEARCNSVTGRSPVPMSITLVNLLDDQSVEGLVMTATDITPLADARAELHYLATHDSLTSLPNRTLIRDRLQHALAGARRRRSGVSVVFCDIDRFKAINDNFGHEVGDELLVEVALRLRSVTRASDTVGRLGGDEFIIVLEDETGEAAEALIARAELALQNPVLTRGQELFVSVSAGVARANESDGVDELLARADADMYRVKRNRQTTGERSHPKETDPGR